jgi:hypothetical protein
MAVVATLISFLALAVSATTAWLTLLRRGSLKMTRPSVIFFGRDGPVNQRVALKVYLRAHLFSTATRPQIVEGMYLTLRRGESAQTFSIRVHGEKDKLVRGCGLSVTADGVAFDHHFLLPRDGTPYVFLPGQYTVQLRANVVGRSSPILLATSELDLSKDQADAISKGAGVYFDWGPDSRTYHAHIDVKSVREVLDELGNRPSTDGSRRCLRRQLAYA